MGEEKKEEAQSSSNVVDLTTRCKMGNCQRGIVEQLTRSRKQTGARYSCSSVGIVTPLTSAID